MSEGDILSTEGNKIERLLAFGDIHGYLDKLVHLLDIVHPSEGDQVVFLGDYIDRGPDSCGVIEKLMEFGRDHPHTVFLRGNHEQLLLDTVNSSRPEDYLLFLQNGGDMTLESYGGELSNVPPEHIEFIRNTKLYSHHQAETVNPESGERNLQEFVFAHAGVRPKVALDKQTKEDLLWIRGQFLHSEYPMGETIIVHGHTPSENIPGKSPYRIPLDSGVYIKGPIKRQGSIPGGKLTCCDVLTRNIWQV